MFEVRGDTLYWLHYPVADIRRDISLGVRRQFEDAILPPDTSTAGVINWDRVEHEIENVQQQIGYLFQLANGFATRAEDIRPDMIPLEVCVVEINVLDHIGNVRHTAERLNNLVERIENELYE